jgi:uncharacterized protein YjaG (DUF416 family)
MTSGISSTVSGYLQSVLGLSAISYHGDQFVGFCIQTLDQTNFSAKGDPLVLSQDFMPLAPFEWEIGQRINKTMYPGSDEPVIQVLGAEYKTQKVKFFATDYNLPDPAYSKSNVNDFTAYGLVNYCQDLVKSREVVLIYWQQGNSIQAIGDTIYSRFVICTGCKIGMRSARLYEIDLEFEVFGNKAPFNDFFVNQSVPSLLDSTKNIVNGVLAATKYLESQQSNIPTTLWTQIGQIVGDVGNVVSGVTNAVESCIDVANNVENQIANIVGIVENAIANVSKMSDQIYNAVCEFNGYKTQIESITAQGIANSFIGMFNVGSQSGGVSNGVSNLSTVVYPGQGNNAWLNNAVLNFLPNLEQLKVVFNNPVNALDTVGVVPSTPANQALIDLLNDCIHFIESLEGHISTIIVRQGQTLGDISRIYCGNPNLYPNIILLNNLTSIVLVSGQELLVPIYD